MQPILRLSLIGLLSLSFIFYVSVVSAQEKDEVIAQPPGGFSLHGHIYHKHLKDAVPPASGYVTDWEKLFSASQVAHLDSLISAFEAKTTIEIAVVTIDSAMASREDFDSVTLKIASDWGVGQKAKNNGLIIGVSNGLHIMRIQTGSGLTVQLPDTDTQQIVDTDFLPYYEKGEYYKGTLHGLQVLMQKLGGN